MSVLVTRGSGGSRRRGISRAGWIDAWLIGPKVRCRSCEGAGGDRVPAGTGSATPASFGRLWSGDSLSITVMAMTRLDVPLPRHHRGLTRVPFGTLLRVWWSRSYAGLRQFGRSVRFIAQNMRTARQAPQRPSRSPERLLSRDFGDENRAGRGDKKGQYSHD